MHTGHYISGAGHLGLLGWLLFGHVFASEPPPFDVTPVSVISGAEYAAMIAAAQPPQSATEVAQPSAPEVTPDAPEVAAAPDQPTEQSQPAPVEAPEVTAEPEVTEPAPPPQAEVADTAPVLPEPPADVAVLVPEVSERPVPRAAERVAPEPVAKPEPEARPDPVEQQAVQPDAQGETTQEPAEATAPEEAATEIVTEAEKPAAAPVKSPRPPARRPEAAVKAAQPAETPAAEKPKPQAQAAAPKDTTSDAVADALAEALAQPSGAPAAPSGPPLSSGEKEALRVAVSSCWNVGSLSSEALKTTVVVTVSMSQDGRPVAPSIRMASSSGGSGDAAGQAFEAARRAIIRCGAKGFNLPAEKYGQWQEIEMTFNPERMRVK